MRHHKPKRRARDTRGWSLVGVRELAGAPPVVRDAGREIAAVDGELLVELADELHHVEQVEARARHAHGQRGEGPVALHRARGASSAASAAASSASREHSAQPDAPKAAPFASFSARSSSARALGPVARKCQSESHGLVREKVGWK